MRPYGPWFHGPKHLYQTEDCFRSENTVEEESSAAVQSATSCEKDQQLVQVGTVPGRRECTTGGRQSGAKIVAAIRTAVSKTDKLFEHYN